MTAYVTGTSTRKVDDLVRALGCESGCRSRRCRGSAPGSTRSGDLPEPSPRPRRVPLRVPGRHLHQGPDQPPHRSRAVVVATGVTVNGDREVLGVDVGDSEDEVFWTAFLRGLKDRRLTGVRLVISDAHAGLKASIPRVLAGAGWQRCKVHLMRNILGTDTSASKDMVAATVRTIFAQPSAEACRTQLHEVVRILDGQFPKAAAILDNAEADVLAHTAFPRGHWRKIASTNPLERINKEIKRRSNVVGIFPDDESVIRLVGAVLLDQHDDWAIAERRYLSEESMTRVDADPEPGTTNTPALPAA
jgi:putative transposase